MPSIITTRTIPQRKSASASPSHYSSSSSSSAHCGRGLSSHSDSRFPSYTPTTVSSYQRRRRDSEIDGLPDRTYFSSGQSKVDRKKEYIQPPTAPTLPSVMSRSRVQGKEMVRYRDPDNQRIAKGREGYDSDDAADNRTVLPSDSISQVSYPSSSAHSSSSGARGRQKRRNGDYGGGGDGGGGSGASTFSSLSTFQSEQVFDGHRKCYLVERRPRVSAGGW